MTENITGAFVDKVLAIHYESLPPEAIAVAKQVLLDTLAVTLAGAVETSGVARISTAYVRDLGEARQASVVAGGFKTSMQSAAYLNGTLASALEYDAAWFPPNHPASPTLPAIWAIAENLRLSGKRVIEAIVTAFEVQARVRLAGTGMPADGGFHKPGTTGLFGAVAGAIKLLDLDRQQASMAFGLAGSRAGSLTVSSGTMTKPSHSGHAARMGVECGVLAKMGWTASADVFGPKGYFDTFMSSSKRELLLEGFASPLRMVDPGVGFKIYPCYYYIHRPIDAALRLRRDFGIRAEQIDRVQVIFTPHENADRPKPRSGLDTKYSAQYVALVALLDGEVTIESFTDERLQKEDIASLLPKVELQFDDSIPHELDRTYSIVNVWLKDGRRLSQRQDMLSGWAGNPPTREQETGKFFSCARQVLDEKAATRVLDLVEGIETLTDATEIMDILRCARPQR